MDKDGATRLPPRNPRGGRPTQDVAEKLGAHILAVALEQFIRHGAEGASMDEIAAAANVSKRTLYARFGSKAGLLRASVKSGIDTKLHIIVEGLPEGTLRERLRFMCGEMLEASLQPDIVGLEDLANWLIRQPEIIASGQAVLVGLAEALEAVCDLLRPYLKPESAADPDECAFLGRFAFDALVTIPRNRILVRKEMPNDREEKDAYLDRTVDLVLRGLPLAAE